MKIVGSPDFSCFLQSSSSGFFGGILGISAKSQKVIQLPPCPRNVLWQSVVYVSDESSPLMPTSYPYSVCMTNGSGEAFPRAPVQTSCISRYIRISLSLFIYAYIYVRVIESPPRHSASCQKPTVYICVRVFMYIHGPREGGREGYAWGLNAWHL